MILAGVRRTSGSAVDIGSVSSEFRGLLGRFLNIGEYCFDKILSYAQLSHYFKQLTLSSTLKQKAFDYVKKQVQDVE